LHPGLEQILAQFTNALANLLQRVFVGSDATRDLLKSTITLFVVLNPIGTVPLFIAITQKRVFKDCHNYFRYILIVFAVGGTEILTIYEWMAEAAAA
jgi:small neutral amino acid transporter SnatA (MarC family)